MQIPGVEFPPRRLEDARGPAVNRRGDDHDGARRFQGAADLPERSFRIRQTLERAVEHGGVQRAFGRPEGILLDVFDTERHDIQAAPRGLFRQERVVGHHQEPTKRVTCVGRQLVQPGRSIGRVQVVDTDPHRRRCGLSAVIPIARRLRVQEQQAAMHATADRITVDDELIAQFRRAANRALPHARPIARAAVDLRIGRAAGHQRQALRPTASISPMLKRRYRRSADAAPPSTTCPASRTASGSRT